MLGLLLWLSACLVCEASQISYNCIVDFLNSVCKLLRSLIFSDLVDSRQFQSLPSAKTISTKEFFLVLGSPLSATNICDSWLLVHKLEICLRTHHRLPDCSGLVTQDDVSYQAHKDYPGTSLIRSTLGHKFSQVSVFCNTISTTTICNGTLCINNNIFIHLLQNWTSMQ